MNGTAEFIQNNFKSIAVLKSNSGSITELVTDSTNAVYIRKTVNSAGLPYQALARINCPDLPEIYYCAEENNKTYVIEEYINGTNLQELLEQQGNFSDKEVLEIVLQLCDVLSTINAHGILHRDIKPGNIILQNGKPWLIDFGAAKILSSKDRDTRILGTPGFAPPEQYGFSSTDARSDIYALGKTMEALLGEGYSGKLKSVIEKCTQFDPQNRIANAGELKKLLLQTQAGTKKRIIAIAAALVICAGSFYYFNSQQQDINIPPQQQIPAEDVQPKENIQPETTIEPEQKAAPKIKNESPPQITSAITAKNLNFTISTNPLYQLAREQGKQAGLTLLELPQGQIPVFTVQNNSTQELQNPQLVIEFSNILVNGSNLTANSWGGRQLNWQLVKNNQGYAGQIIIRLSGTIPANDYFDFPLAGAVANYYQSGSPAAAKVTLTADNLQAATQTYNIKIN